MQTHALSRRTMLKSAACGFGGLAFSGLTAGIARAATSTTVQPSPMQPSSIPTMTAMATNATMMTTTTRFSMQWMSTHWIITVARMPMVTRVMTAQLRVGPQTLTTTVSTTTWTEFATSVTSATPTEMA